jgi:hypothetical protein
MRIDSALPMHIARAYAIKPSAPAAAAAKPQAVNDLVAGRVAKGVDFNAPAAPMAGGNVLQLYNRAADRVEAAVSIQIGKQLDVKG